MLLTEITVRYQAIGWLYLQGCWNHHTLIERHRNGRPRAMPPKADHPLRCLHDDVAAATPSSTCFVIRHSLSRTQGTCQFSLVGLCRNLPIRGSCWIKPLLDDDDNYCIYINRLWKGMCLRRCNNETFAFYVESGGLFGLRLPTMLRLQAIRRQDWMLVHESLCWGFSVECEPSKPDWI